MTELAVEIEGLVKRFGRRVVAVDELTLSVGAGATFGLLGPNGAGKTTVLRILLGLVKPTSGRVSVYGHRPGSRGALERVGAMGEVAFYPFLSGRTNLRAIARRCRVRDRRVDSVLERVGLGPRGEDDFGTYSLGMKQRLGVAAALLKDPELLVLDEPSNGLDPVGQMEMRNLIRELGEEGRTVILSSHDLSDVEDLCDRVCIINGGRSILEGTPEELRGDSRLWLRASPQRAAAVLVAEHPAVVGVDTADDMLVLSFKECSTAVVADVNKGLVAAGLDVSELQARRPSLESVFLERTEYRTAGQDSLRSNDTNGKRSPGARSRSSIV